MPDTKDKLGIIFFPAFDWAISPTHPKREERLLYTQDQFLEEGIFDLGGITEHKPLIATDDILTPWYLAEMSSRFAENPS